MKPIAKRAVGWAFALVAGAATALIGPFEGKRNQTYLDVVGVPTVCYGHTGRFAKMGASYTDEECSRILAEDIEVHYNDMRRCLSAKLAFWEEIAALSMFFNFGGQLCTSTYFRLMNTGAPPEQFCPQILRWNKAGGNVLRGLVRRREIEYRVCMGDISLLFITTIPETELYDFFTNRVTSHYERIN